MMTSAGGRVHLIPDLISFCDLMKVFVFLGSFSASDHRLHDLPLIWGHLRHKHIIYYFHL